MQFLNKEPQSGIYMMEEEFNLENQYSDVWVNLDSPDVMYIEIDAEENYTPAVLISITDLLGEPVSGAFTLEGLDLAIQSLNEAKEMLEEMNDSQ